jgi:DNA-binding transcriptional MerR regulator
VLSIGKLGRAAGVKVPTIRYYEQIGLVRPATRTEGNQRLYTRETLARLSFIRHARDLGFPLEAIRDLLALQDDPHQPCAAADAIARAQLEAVNRRIGQLEALRCELEKMVAHCAHGSVAECRVIEVLGNHDLCLHPDHEAAHDRADHDHAAR